MAHPTQQEFCKSIKGKFPEYFKDTRVLDVGSLDINGNNKYLFDNCNYIGLDIVEGSNVNIISIAHEYTAPDESFDVIISTEAFEHDMYLDKTLHNIVRMLRPGGLFLFTCATTGRTPHGTAESDPNASPTSKIEGWKNYYKNLTEEDIKKILDIDKTFSSYEFSTEVTDLRFWGIKELVVTYLPKDENQDLLTSLADKYQSDKGTLFFSHLFTKIYDSYLFEKRNEVKKVLEIGIGQGGSLRMWRDYFPNAEVYGIDIDSNVMFKEDRITTFIVNQGIRAHLEGLLKTTGGDFDVIIDDGSHMIEHQQISFGYLFKYLKSGGLYIIEDLHTSFGWGGMDWGLPNNPQHTTYNILDYYIKTKKIESPYMMASEIKYLEESIKRCDIYETHKEVHDSIVGVVEK